LHTHDAYEAQAYFLWRVYIVAHAALSFLYGVLLILGARSAETALTLDESTMSPERAIEHDLDRAARELRLAPALTAEVLARVVALTCTRIPLLAKAGKTARMRHLIEAGAHVDAALALIALELPQWQLRRLVHDDGRWHCALSQQRNLPIEFDQTADGSHEDAAMAILTAFIEALRMARAGDETAIRTVPDIPVADYAICCDNFR
jgi:hypothetical protein